MYIERHLTGVWFLQQNFKIFTFSCSCLILLCPYLWDVKYCPMSRITTPLARKRPFHWISMKSRLVRAARETSKFQNWSHITNSRRRYMAEILPIRRKTLSNQSSYTFSFDYLEFVCELGGGVVLIYPNFISALRHLTVYTDGAEG